LKTSASKSSKLSDRFVAPPFSILDSRQGYWQEKKRQWLSLGIQSELGRDDKQVSDGREENAPWRGFSKSFSTFEGEYSYPTTLLQQTGTSVFDPVLCELAYRWFCPDDGVVLDPFAGGSVRGIVASKLNYRYIGVELRAEQVDANRMQSEDICKSSKYPPVWHIGDSREIDKLDVQADLIFSCPPYANLEVYSDNPLDISTLAYGDFLVAYREIIAKSVSKLQSDRFACFVVGDIRSKNGFYRNFVGDTISAFQDCGCFLYNEAILITPFGSLPIRAAKSFNGARKLGKTHQNVLVFFKGNPKNIGEIYNDIGDDAHTTRKKNSGRFAVIEEFVEANQGLGSNTIAKAIASELRISEGYVKQLLRKMEKKGIILNRSMEGSNGQTINAWFPCLKLESPEFSGAHSGEYVKR
jgi:DNA modification methylase